MRVGDLPLEGKIAVVTGGGSGINLAFVKLCLKNSARALIADLTLTPEADDVVRVSGGKAAYVKCDVVNWKDLKALPDVVEEKFGKGSVAEVWIAGAGIFEPPWSNWHEDPEEERYATLDVNTAHPLKLTRIATRSLLKAQKKGVIVILSSSAGLSPTYGASLYIASKHAITGFVRSMAQLEKDEGIKVVAICPGAVDTPLWTSELRQKFGFNSDNAASTDEVAEAIAKIVQEGEYIGGQMMKVEKGMTEKLPGSEHNYPEEVMEPTYRTVRVALAKDKPAGKAS